MDDLRAVNGLTAQVGRSAGMRPPARIDTDMDGGNGSEYQPNDWQDEDQPATTRVRRRQRGPGSISSDDIPSPSSKNSTACARWVRPAPSTPKACAGKIIIIAKVRVRGCHQCRWFGGDPQPGNAD